MKREAHPPLSIEGQQALDQYAHAQVRPLCFEEIPMADITDTIGSSMGSLQVEEGENDRDQEPARNAD